MTKEEHDILAENNVMLKQILAYIYSKEGSDKNFQDFTMNVIANIISNNLNYNQNGREIR